MHKTNSENQPFCSLPVLVCFDKNAMAKRYLRICFSLQFQGAKCLQWWGRHCGRDRRLRDHILVAYRKQRAGSGRDHQSSKPTPVTHFLLQSCTFSLDSITTEDQLLKNRRLWRTFFIQTTSDFYEGSLKKKSKRESMWSVSHKVPWTKCRVKGLSPLPGSFLLPVGGWRCDLRASPSGCLLMRMQNFLFLLHHVCLHTAMLPPW